MPIDGVIRGQLNNRIITISKMINDTEVIGWIRQIYMNGKGSGRACDLNDGEAVEFLCTLFLMLDLQLKARGDIERILEKKYPHIEFKFITERKRNQQHRQGGLFEGGTP